jgi:hypothetical protein
VSEAITITPVTETITVEDTGEVLTMIDELVSVVSVGVMGPPGPMGPAGEEDMPTSPVVDPKSSSSLAAGNSVNLDSVVIASGKIAKVQQITLSSSAACKWEIQSMTAGVPTTLDVVFTAGVSGNQPSHEWEPPHRDYAALTGDGSTTFFRVAATNLDARNPANVYATFFFDEVLI